MRYTILLFRATYGGSFGYGDTVDEALDNVKTEWRENWGGRPARWEIKEDRTVFQGTQKKVRYSAKVAEGKFSGWSRIKLND